MHTRVEIEGVLLFFADSAHSTQAKGQKEKGGFFRGADGGVPAVSVGIRGKF